MSQKGNYQTNFRVLELIQAMADARERGDHLAESEAMTAFKEIIQKECEEERRVKKQKDIMLWEAVHMLLSHAHQLYPLLNEEERLSDLGKLVKVIADDIEAGKISVGNVSASELLNTPPWSFVFKNN